MSVPLKSIFFKNLAPSAPTEMNEILVRKLFKLIWQVIASKLMPSSYLAKS